MKIQPIKYLRKFHSISLGDLSKETGLSESYISLLENGKRSPNPELEERFKKAIDFLISRKIRDHHLLVKDVV